MENDVLVAQVAAETVYNAVDDWVPMAEIYSLVKERAPQVVDREIKDAVLAVVESLLADGLVDAGQLSAEGFVAWGGNQAEILNRLRESLNSDNSVDWDFACWVRNTPKGMELGAELEAEWGADGPPETR